jgi:hypothetical protein
MSPAEFEATLRQVTGAIAGLPVERRLANTLESRSPQGGEAFDRLKALCRRDSAEGWPVYGPGSAHHPTVTGGRAVALYLLPGGAVRFTRT